MVLRGANFQHLLPREFTAVGVGCVGQSGVGTDVASRTEVGTSERALGRDHREVLDRASRRCYDRRSGGRGSGSCGRRGLRSLRTLAFAYLVTLGHVGVPCVCVRSARFLYTPINHGLQAILQLFFIAAEAMIAQAVIVAAVFQV